MRPVDSRIKVAIFSLCLVLCANMANSVMDTLVSRYSQSVFSSLPAAEQPWFNPKLSYRNKWKDGDRTHGEAYFLSSTVLVPLTDAWHFFKFLTILCLWAAILAPFTLLFRLRWYYWFLIWLGAGILRGVIFELFYTRLLIR